MTVECRLEMHCTVGPCVYSQNSTDACCRLTRQLSHSLSTVNSRQPRTHLRHVINGGQVNIELLPWQRGKMAVVGEEEVRWEVTVGEGCHVLHPRPRERAGGGRRGQHCNRHSTVTS